MKSAAFTKSYESNPVLTIPAADWDPGTIYAVIGPNGSGKSTLAKVFAGVLKPDQKQSPVTGEQIGYLPQKPYAFRMRVEKNLYLNGSDLQRSQELLHALSLHSLRKKNAKRLSGGETAKLALARLLMRDYSVLILDEPTAAMDMESTIAAENLIRHYKEQTNCTVILVTHSIQQARRLADRVLYFEKGRLVESGEASSMLRDPKDPATRNFLQFFGFDKM